MEYEHIQKTNPHYYFFPAFFPVSLFKCWSCTHRQAARQYIFCDGQGINTIKPSVFPN